VAPCCSSPVASLANGSEVAEAGAATAAVVEEAGPDVARNGLLDDDDDDVAATRVGISAESVGRPSTVEPFGAGGGDANVTTVVLDTNGPTPDTCRVVIAIRLLSVVQIISLVCVYSFFIVRCNIYISRLGYDVSVRLSVRLSATEVHWRIIANLGFKFRSHFTGHCGRRAAGSTAAVLLAVLLAGGSSRAILASARSLVSF